jgi:hypothetical protein
LKSAIGPAAYEIRGAYNAAEYLEQRRGMMQMWADLLDAKAKGK